MELKYCLALGMCACLLLFPARCAEQARSAMALWAQAVAPTLFPFLALLPVLTSEEARDGYERLFARPMRAFRLPGRAASAAVVGLMAGTPAGAAAAGRCANALSPRQRFTLGILVSGLGPVFLVCSVGAGMFADAAVGARLWGSMALSLMLGAFLCARLPETWFHGRTAADAAARGENAMTSAIMGVLSVCGWMTLTSVIGGLLPEAAQPYIEVSRGCFLAAQARNATLAAFLCGFGGICAGLQNRARLTLSGVDTRWFFPVKALCGGLCAGIYRLTEYLRLPAMPETFAPYRAACLCAAALAVLALLLGIGKVTGHRRGTAQDESETK